MGAGFASLSGAEPELGNRFVRSETPAKRPASVETFNKIATTIFGYNGAFLINEEGELGFQVDPEEAHRYKWIRPLLQPLIEKVGSKELASSGRAGTAAEQSWVELMRLEGRPTLAGVIAVPELARLTEEDSSELFLVVFRFLDGRSLDALSREQGLAGARYARTADAVLNEVAFQVQATDSGEPLGFIIWEPDLPGSRVLGRLVPMLSAASLIVAALFFALMVRLRRSLRDLSASEQHARHLSVHDVLTGLPNRAMFASRFGQAMANVRSDGNFAAIALIDLDKFKEVNDNYGHAAGDELLRLAVARMSRHIGEEDTLARVGGDEFALLFPNPPDDRHYLSVCNEIIKVMDAPFKLLGSDVVVRVGCSIGTTRIPRVPSTASELLRRADIALYEAKASGRGRHVEYDSAMDHWGKEQEALKKDLRAALDLTDQTGDEGRDRTAGQLEVFFQGVHRANATGSLSGAEALVRWRHPSRGLLTPDHFIPIAEEAGMIDKLGEWVFRAAAREASHWPEHLTLAVNVSPSQLRRLDFDSQLFAILSETGLSPSRLELELTEAALFDIDEHNLVSLERLRSRGVSIALDDFGTGYSSLSHLIQFNIDRIKIDRAFVRLLGTQAEGAAIISAILDLSRTLGKTTTAEGVETEAQKDFLIAAGCTELQGFLLSQPKPAKDFRLGLPVGNGDVAA
jgi:diguanylate cyclase (GGDEF)-like protein